MPGLLDHPAQAFYLALMVLGVAGIYVAAFLLWPRETGADRPEWRLWLLLAVAAAATVVGTTQL